MARTQPFLPSAFRDKIRTKKVDPQFMSYRTIVELTARISAESCPEQKVALLEQLRILLNEDKEMIHANLATFFPGVGSSFRMHTAVVSDVNSLRRRADELRIKAASLVLEADALTVIAENLQSGTAVKDGAKRDNAPSQATNAA
jgi:GTP-sensing pleiotropic transcriptional regulator CodY